MSSQKAFASTGDLAEKKISFTEIGPDLYAYTARRRSQHGRDRRRRQLRSFRRAGNAREWLDSVIEKVRTVTDKPIKYVILSHYHAVRVLGASALPGEGISRPQETHRLVVERGQQDWESEYGRFPRLFRDAESIPGLTWPTLAFKGEMTLFLGKRE